MRKRVPGENLDMKYMSKDSKHVASVTNKLHPTLWQLSNMLESLLLAWLPGFDLFLSGLNPRTGHHNT